MRTTLTLDDDVIRKLEEEQRRTRRSFKEVVNDALRSGLAMQAKPKKRARFVVHGHSCGGLQPGLDASRLNQLVDDLEAEHFLAVSQRPKA